MVTREPSIKLDKPARRRVRDIAASLGCVASRGATAGEGSLTALLSAIAGGEVVCVKREDWLRMMEYAPDFEAI